METKLFCKSRKHLNRCVAAVGAAGQQRPPQLAATWVCKKKVNLAQSLSQEHSSGCTEAFLSTRALTEHCLVLTHFSHDSLTFSNETVKRSAHQNKVQLGREIRPCINNSSSFAQNYRHEILLRERSLSSLKQYNKIPFQMRDILHYLLESVSWEFYLLDVKKLFYFKAQFFKNDICKETAAHGGGSSEFT